MKAVITDKLLRAVAAKKQPHAPVSDQILRGFGVRFSKRGEPSFFAIRRLRGGPKQPIRLHVGRYPALSLADARERAWALLCDLQNGIDPHSARSKSSAQSRRNRYTPTGRWPRTSLSAPSRASGQRAQSSFASGAN